MVGIRKSIGEVAKPEVKPGITDQAAEEMLCFEKMIQVEQFEWAPQRMQMLRSSYMCKRVNNHHHDHYAHGLPKQLYRILTLKKMHHHMERNSAPGL